MKQRKVHLLTVGVRNRKWVRCNFTLRPRLEYQTLDPKHVTCENCRKFIQ